METAPSTALITPAAPPQSQQATPAATTTASPSTSPPAQPASTPATQTPAAAPQNLMTASAQEIPEKFRVVKADGTVDHEASLQKALGSVAHLEKRLGTGDIPPENEAGYKLDYSAFPEGIKISPEGEKTFLKSMHSAGLTNKQVQAVVNRYAEALKQGLSIQQTQAASRATETVISVNAELAKAWGENNSANISAAQRAFAHLADDADKADMEKIGIDAGATYRMFMKFLAKVGAGLSEDTAVTAGEAATLNQSLQELRTSKAYLDESDPQHKATVEKVTAMYNRLYPKK